MVTNGKLKKLPGTPAGCPRDAQRDNRGLPAGASGISCWIFSIEKRTKNYAAPIGAFFCPEIRAFTGFWGEISSTASKVLSDRKVPFKHENGR